MLRKIITALLALITVTTAFIGCTDKSPDGFYSYDLNEYLSVKDISLTVDRATLDKNIRSTYQEASQKDATTTVYGGTTAGAQPADGITVENGDTANIDYVGTLNGVAFAGGTAKGSDLVIGSGQFIDGFESGLVGAKVGETRALNLTFPEAYHSAELAGKSVVFTVTVNYIKRPVYPEYNEENVKKYTGSTIAELEKTLIGKIVFDTIYNETTVKKYPQKELESTVNKYVNAYTQQAQQYGMTLEAYITNAYRITIEQFTEQITAKAQQYVKRDMLTYYIVEQFPQLKIDDSNYEAEVQSLYNELKENGEYTGTYEELIQYNDKADIMISIYSRRVQKYFSENATVTE